MSLDELDALLTGEFELVADSGERGNGRSYFWRKVVWNPASTTRILRAHHDANGTVTHIRLSVSSDNNNSILVPAPFEAERVRAAIAREIALFCESRSRAEAGLSEGAPASCAGRSPS